MLAQTREAPEVHLMYEILRNTHQVHDNNCAHFFIFHILQKKCWNIWLVIHCCLKYFQPHFTPVLHFAFKNQTKLKSRPVNMEVLYMILLFVYLQSDTKDVIFHA